MSMIGRVFYAALAGVICMAGLVSCLQQKDLRARGTPPGPATELMAEIRQIYPATPDRLPTTSATIYLGNLNSQIDSLTSVSTSHPDSIHRANLATLLYHRYRILGHLQDVERALAEANQTIDANPGHPEGLLARAAILSALHRFDEALNDLEAAAAAGAREQRLAPLRREIALALGQYEEVDDLENLATKASSDFQHAVLLGNLSLLKGRVDLASARFLEAQQLYTDSSPFQLAWLFTQQGIALLRTGDCMSARIFLEAALKRVPQYYLAAEHLAECEWRLGQLDKARQRYRAVIEQTGNPEFMGALAELEMKAGNDKIAKQLFRQAESRWEEVLAQHPAAFADHAAQFFVAAGKPERAFELSSANLENRSDVLSLLVHASTSAENGRHKQACHALEQAISTGMRPPEMLEFERLADRCGFKPVAIHFDRGVVGLGSMQAF